MVDPARILLVDDDPDFTFALSTLLTRDGFAVDVRHRGDVALDAAREASFDVALVDLSLPDTSGLSLLDSLGQVDPLLPVVCLTGNNDTTAVVQAMRKGAVDYLTKPVDRATLHSTVQSATNTARARRAGAGGGGTHVIGGSFAWRQTMAHLAAAASANKTTVLITGEPGVGKEVIAAELHRQSGRAQKPMVAANAACFSPALMESELFGHEAGAFTGAAKRRRGLFEQADGGVLFLDEIGELPLDLQSKLLRVLEGHAFRRVGGEEPVKVDVRLIAATNRDLATMVQEGTFRADLLERIRVFEIKVPPLRDRRDDIPLLANHFLARLGKDTGHPSPGFEPEAMEVLRHAAWPGNVRELRNVVERGLVLAGGAAVGMRHIGELSMKSTLQAAIIGDMGVNDDQPANLEEVTRQHIILVFRACDGNVTKTAERLGMSRLALRKRLQAYGLRPVRGEM